MPEAASQSENYLLARVQTTGATGYFACAPVEARDFDSALAWSRGHPNDEFMRRYLLRLIAAWSPRELKRRIGKTEAGDLFLKALFFEACLLLPRFAALRTLFPAGVRQRLAQHSPLPYIPAHRQADHHLHAAWMQRLQPNFFAHAPLPDPDELGLPPPVDAAAVARAMAVTQPIERLSVGFTPTLPETQVSQQAPETLTALAMERLAQAGIAVEQEMRHEASLSPIALLRQWRFAVQVHSGRHHYRLCGEQISYGRGLDLESARVACVMEIVERVSAYAAIADNQVPCYRNSYPLINARFSELKAQGRMVLDPNRLGLEAPYLDAPLFWIEGQSAAGSGARPVWVPAQAVFLFCNLDEIKLFSGLGSNGLGAGASLAEAKCKALLEVIERDCGSVVPYTPALCFDVETVDDRLSRLLRSYADQRIDIGFLDITGPLGLPCCKCFVRHGNGEIAVGTAAHLDARRALISALTETPYPYPGGPPSQPLPPAAVRVPLESLPNYDRGDPEQNLALLEQLLRVNGFEPIYVDLTRADLALPVVRALVPGMELSGDFDRFSRVHPRLYGHYLKYAVRGR
jgi:ribosomal protein S12 methylthiotransferase accessory factor YcaO